MRVTLRESTTLKIIACIASGSLLGMATAHDFSGFEGALILVALVPFLWAITDARVSSTVLRAIVTATFYGCVSSAWMPEALASLGSSPIEAYAGWAFAGMWAKVFVLIPAAITFRVFESRSDSSLTRILSFALPWAVAEALMYFAPNGLPWAFIGHSQSNVSGTAQLAVIGGVPFVSFIIVCINVAIFDSVVRREHLTSRRLALSLVTAWAVLSLVGLPTARALRPSNDDEVSIRVLLVQPNLPRGDRQSQLRQRLNLARLSHQTKRALNGLSQPVDVVYWPEGSLNLSAENRAEILEELARTVDDLDVPLVLGINEIVRDPIGDTSLNYVVRFDPALGMTSRLLKETGVPGVEASAGAFTQEVARLFFGEAARKPLMGHDSHQEIDESGFVGVPVLCFEGLFAPLTDRRRAETGGKFIVNLSDDSWVEGEIATDQLVKFAQFRAIEQRLPFLRVAHGGRTVATNEFGEMISVAPTDVPAELIVGFTRSAPAGATEKIGIVGVLIVIGSLTWLVIPAVLRIRWWPLIRKLMSRLMLQNSET